jgi:conjugative transfer signal peptidase TraF
MSLKAAVAGISILALGSVLSPMPRLVWNASASAPVGFYFVTRDCPRRGDLVLARTPEHVRTLAAERLYLPANVPLVKRVAALSGDQICADETTIFINGDRITTRLKTDSEGRPLPIWTGCHRLADEVLLLMRDVPASFDGRYFGAVPLASIIGHLHPLWIHTN